MTEQLIFAALSHVGLVRDNNEDYYAVVYPGTGYPMALILADGMGGHNKGEVASRIAVDFLASFLREDLVTPKLSVDYGRKLPELIKKANVKVYLSSLDDAECKGMGTTLTAGVIRSGLLTIAHVGDCRAYLFRKNSLSQLTTDHTMVQQMVDAGSLSVDESHKHPQRNILTRALGFPEFITPDAIQLSIHPGDILIFCSDGLHGFVPDQTIAHLARKTSTPAQLAEQLVAAALSAGGEDNVTVLIAQVSDASRTEVQL